LEVVEHLVKTLPLIFKINGGLTKVIHLLLLLAAEALLVLQLLLEASVLGQRFLELSVQPLHRNGMALLHPLESGLQLGSICMAEILQIIGQKAKRYYTCNIKWQKKVTATSKLLLQIRHKQIFSASSLSCELTAWTRSSTTFL
jgi:hypothetical protein